MLHPVEGVAGHPVTVEHVDGREEQATFPELISPGQPFFAIRALTHEVTPGVCATCTMESVDGFEMEDQRNWTDASYKTYVRSLLQPWPYTHRKGEKFEQAVRLSFSGRIPAAAVVRRVGADPHRDRRAGRREQCRRSASACRPRKRPTQSKRCRSCRRWRRSSSSALSTCARTPGAMRSRTIARSAETLSAEVALEIVIPGQEPEAELGPVALAVRKAGLSPAAVSVFPEPYLHSYQPSGPWPKVAPEEDIAAAARRAFPAAKLGGGMYAYFTELNRKRPTAALYDFVSHTTSPIVHAADDRSVMESLEALRTVTLSTRAMIDEKPYRVGPSAIGCRDNPYGKAPFDNSGNGRVPLAKIDPRQRGLLNAAWTLGYVAALARGGVEAVAMGAPTGPSGFIHRKADYSQPWFDELPGPAVYPAFHVMIGLAKIAGTARHEVSPSRPGVVDAIASSDGKSTTMWATNLTGGQQQIELAALPQGKATIVELDEDAFDALAIKPDFPTNGARDFGRGPLTLGAYAVACIEIAK